MLGVVSAPFLAARLPEAPYLRRFLRGAAIFLFLYFLTEDFSMPRPAVAPNHPALAFQDGVRWVALALAALGWFRPAALVTCAFALMMLREALGASLVGAVQRSSRVSGVLALDRATATRAGVLLLAAGVGAHLGNYFYSAIAKFALDGGPLSWLLDNRLYDGVPSALEKGTFPFARWPGLTQAIYETAKVLNFPIQLAGLLIQASAIAAPLRRRWVIAAALAFDAFHILVYLLFGLIFWKWVALNVLIAATFAAMPEEAWDKAARRVCLGFVGAGILFFTTATLAWYDASAYASVFFEARTKDGRSYRVPNAYFDMASYQVSQGRLYFPPGQGHFAANIWGSVLTKADLKASRACAPPEAAQPERYGPPELLGRYVAEAHAKALSRKPGYDYRWRLHHHLPSPFVADPFVSLDNARSLPTFTWWNRCACRSRPVG